MKINIGPYSSDLIPVRRWEHAYERFRSGSFYHKEEDHNKFDKAVYKCLDWLWELCLPINRWSNNRKRKVKIDVQYYDIYDASHTIALIVTPVLKKLKEEKTGVPFVDNEDRPEHLRVEGSYENGSEEYYEAMHKAWEYVLDEMIWAFEQSANDDWEDQYFHNTDQLEIVPSNSSKDGKISFIKQKDQSKPPYWVDYDGIKAHRERMLRGRMLFAKYYEALWD